MIEFAITMNQISTMLEGPDSPVTQEFGKRAECFANKLHEYLLSENMGRYADYVSL